MKAVFWGTLFNPDNNQQLLNDSKVGLQNASNTYQWGFIEGLSNNGQNKIDVISALPVGSYPKSNKKLFFFQRKYKYKNVIVSELGFINFYLIREQILTREFYKKTKLLLKNKEKVVLYVYSLYLPFLLAMLKLKKEYGQNLHICLIVPDLPGEHGIMRSVYSLSGIWDRLIANKTISLARKADSYVLLTKQMKSALQIDKPFCVVEGFFSNNDFSMQEFLLKNSNNNNKIIFYAGSLNLKFGINQLLESFSEIEDSNYRLWLCGPPNEAKGIIEAAQRDSRIQYLGYLPKKEINMLQQQSTLLINPRQNTGNYVQYSFPSKTMEYLASGKPVVMYNLAGIPPEYDQFINYVGTSLKETIIEIASKPAEELEQIGKRGKEWVIKEKNNTAQIRKVKEMLDEISSN